MRKFALLVALMILGSCSGNGGPAPSNQTDACSILEQRRGWHRDLLESEAKYGIPVPVMMATIWKESSFRARAKPSRTYAFGSIPTGRRSSAYGYSQALDGTWEWYQDETGNHRGDRDDFDDAVDFIGWYLDRSNRVNGIAKDDAYNLYLSYHEGHSGFQRGTYNSKQWLINTAREVQAMATRYESQLPFCRR